MMWAQVELGLGFLGFQVSSFGFGSFLVRT